MSQAVEIADSLERALHRARGWPWRPVLLSFLLARLLVLAAVLLARWVAVSKRRFDGVLGWDARWYRDIAERGYAHVPPTGERFFPLLPLTARALAAPFGGSASVSLLIISNFAALAYALLGYRLAVGSGLSEDAARMMPWVIAFTPAAFVLVMGYTESVFGALICLTLLGARQRRWLWVAAAAACAGLLRPNGVVLALPILIEALLSFKATGLRQRLASAVAVLAPVLGLSSYLLWSANEGGKALGPLRSQTAPDLRGGLAVDPLSWIWTALGRLAAGDVGRAAPLLHLVWAAVAIWLLVQVARQLPLSYIAFTAATLLLALTARNMASFERYAESAVPLLMIVCVSLRQSRHRVALLILAGFVMFGYSLAAFAHGYIP
jgi:hypothetical protein